jgi:hypothetical protein
MIISNEQAQAAAAYLKLHQSHDCERGACSVSADVIAKARAAVEMAPELRLDRVNEARERMGAGAVDSREVAEKMLSRIVSDALR